MRWLVGVALVLACVAGSAAQSPTVFFREDCSSAISTNACCWDTGGADAFTFFCGNGTAAVSIASGGQVQLLSQPPTPTQDNVTLGDMLIYPDEAGTRQACTVVDATPNQVDCRTSSGAGGPGSPGPAGPQGPPGPPGEPGNPGEGFGGLLDIEDCGNPNPAFVLRSKTDPSVRVIPCNRPDLGGIIWQTYPAGMLPFVDAPLVHALGQVTIADSGDEDPGALTLDPTDFTGTVRGVLLLTCADAQNCALTLEETSNPPEGTQLELINVAAPLITLTDQADVLEVGGVLTLGQDHVLRLRRVLGRWVRNDPPALLAGTDTQVLYFDGTAPAGDADLTFNNSTKALTVTGGVVTACDAATTECGWLNVPVETAEPSDTTDTGTANVIVRANVGLQTRQGTGSTQTYIHDAGGQTINGALTLTGVLSSLVNVQVVTADTGTLVAADMAGQWYINTDTGDAFDRTLAAAAAGLSACFYAGSTEVITLDAAAGDVIQLNGTNLTAANAIDGPATQGAFLCLLAIDGTTWITLGRSGTWVDGGAD